MALQVVDLTTTHLEPAVALVCKRYRSLRGAVPLLPPQYGERDTLYPMLQQVLQAGSGVVAVRDSQITGFLAGFDIGEFQGGPAAYSPEWANGARPDESARIYEAMYTHLADMWVATALLSHALAWAREAGYRRCAVDFETTNPLARRFWLRHFTPVTYSLGRHVDRRVLMQARPQSST
ncbi:MAG: GNAT family N-acetyltransferase [Anaerolineae bacterium]